MLTTEDIDSIERAVSRAVEARRTKVAQDRREKCTEILMYATVGLSLLPLIFVIFLVLTHPK
jgi:hypothetical protein